MEENMIKFNSLIPELRVTDIEKSKELLIQDPDGYLLRFTN